MKRVHHLFGSGVQLTEIHQMKGDHQENEDTFQEIQRFLSLVRHRRILFRHTVLFFLRLQNYNISANIPQNL